MPECRLCGKKLLFKMFLTDGYCQPCYKWKQEAAERDRQKEAALNSQKEGIRKWIELIPSYNLSFPEMPYKRQTGYKPFDFSNITPKGKYDGSVVVFDTETTGLSPAHDRIVEIGAIRYLNGEPIEKFHSYVDPERHIPEDITKINNITDDMVAGSPVIGQVLPSFDKFIGDSILVAHNLEFDLKFIYYSGSKVLETKRKYIDTLEQARELINKNDVYDYKLETLAGYYKLTIPDAHSALADAFAAGWLFYHLILEKQGSVHFMSKPPV